MTNEVITNMQDVLHVIDDDLSHDPMLVPGQGVEISRPTDRDALPMTKLYREAYSRSDFFAGRYDDPEEQIFNPDWLRQDYKNPDHLWFTFKDSSGAILGSTGFFHDGDSQTETPLLTSDETQIQPAGRGKRIMGHFFRRIVPLIEESGAGLVTDFVLSRESKGLRRSLQTEQGMIALGIHPHILRHPESGTTISEISAAKYPNLEVKTAKFLQAFEPIFRIVQQQLPNWPEPQIVTEAVRPITSRHSDNYEESEPVSATDIAGQADALRNGYMPVGYDPDSNTFRLAHIPLVQPDHSYVLDNEQIGPNKELVWYEQNVLYSISRAINEKQR